MKTDWKEVRRFLYCLVIIIWMVATLMTCASVWNGDVNATFYVTAVISLLGSVFYGCKEIKGTEKWKKE